MSKKRVAVIGAGASGLVAIKCCLDEGLEPVCFERTSHIGGLWYYSEDVTDAQGSVAKTTVINTAKEIMTYSDFPIPKDSPNYMHNTKLMEYFRKYAKNFDLEKYIQFNVEVTKVRKTDDFSQTGRWDFDIRNISTGDTIHDTFDAVLVCSGHHADKHVPRFDGDNVFKGKIIHTHDYRSVEGFADKRILVVGIGNSGGDAAVDLSRIASQVFLSTRRGAWIGHRIGVDGIPNDYLFFKRSAMAFARCLPTTLLQSMIEGHLNKRLDHTMYGLKPKHRIFQQHPTVNDELPNRICCGSIMVKPDVKRFTETGVEFLDGTEHDVDVIILATGYIFGFPYLDKGIIEVENNKVDLFKYVFPPELERPTLAVVGCVQPIGAINPISELMCRWATRVFKGETKLPSKVEMLADIRAKREAMAGRYVTSQRHTIQVDYIPFMDELAEQFGCKPSIGKLLLKDPQLAHACFFKTWTPYQYRLTGPGKWDGAREAILTVKERIVAPLQTRHVEPDIATGSSTMKYAVLALILALLYWWCQSN